MFPMPSCELKRFTNQELASFFKREPCLVRYKDLNEMNMSNTQVK